MIRSRRATLPKGFRESVKDKKNLKNKRKKICESGGYVRVKHIRPVYGDRN